MDTKSDNFVNIVSLYEYDKCIDWLNECKEICSKLNISELIKMDFQDLMKRAGCFEEYIMAKKIKDLEDKINKLNSDF